MSEGKIGVIGGSGLYQIEGIQNVHETKVSTPFGDPSDAYIEGELNSKRLVFLPRHGRGHKISPTEINYRANIYGMKKLGVQWILSASAVGSLKEELKPLDIVIPDQFVDRTNLHRPSTFFGSGLVAHITFADPVCSKLGDIIYNAAVDVGVNAHRGGTYLNMEGPAFSTRAESNLYRSWGMDIIGMTNLVEAKLAREAEICYTTMALVTDYDCWHEEHDDVSVDQVIKVLMQNVENAKKVIAKAVESLPNDRSCKCATALKNAILTDRKAIPNEAKEKLDLLIGKYV